MPIADVPETDTMRPPAPSEAETHGAGDGGLTVVAGLVGVYCLGIGLFRLPELTSARWVFDLPAQAFEGMSYPSWWIWFLWAMVVGVIIVGLVAIAGSILRLLRSPLAPRLLLGAAVMLAAWAVGQTAVRIVFDPDIAQGGMIWGAVHNLTLTRIENYGATPAGVAGYVVGLVGGGLLWLAGAALFLRASLTA